MFSQILQAIDKKLNEKQREKKTYLSAENVFNLKSISLALCNLISGDAAIKNIPCKLVRILPIINQAKSKKMQK